MFGALLGNPYVLAGLAIVCFGGGWTVNGWRHDADKKDAIEAALKWERETVAKRDLQFVAQQTKDEQLAAMRGAVREELGAIDRNVQSALRGQKLTIKPEPTNATPCPDTRRSSAYRLCINAAYSADAADIAACEAARGNGTVPAQLVPTTGVVRSSL